ncbi:hypothetical protein JCM33374_g1463 [Metschnikowia sp. JCM 33374]|nr:hypothetical protein JCM33374_g1463 [Metschnikowia sp. JCM 33374]
MNKLAAAKPCAGCGHTEFTRDFSATAGDVLCSGCGMVQVENPIVSEVQFGESSSGAATVQGAMVGADQARVYNMRNSLESREQTLMNAKQKIKLLATSMRIPDYIHESACGWFKLALVQNFVQGRRSQNVIAACLYVACRHEKTPHLLIDFSSRLQISVYSLGATYLKLVRALQIQRLPLADPSLFIQHFAERLQFKEHTAKVCRDATKIAQRMSSDWIYEGRRPAGIAGACLLLAARMNNFRRSHAEIVAVARVGEETLQKRLNEFKKTSSAALSVSDFRDSAHTNDSQPPSFQKNRAIESKIEKLLKQRAHTLKKYQELAKSRELFKHLDLIHDPTLGSGILDLNPATNDVTAADSANATSTSANDAAENTDSNSTPVTAANSITAGSTISNDATANNEPANDDSVNAESENAESENAESENAESENTEPANSEHANAEPANESATTSTKDVDTPSTDVANTASPAATTEAAGNSAINTDPTNATTSVETPIKVAETGGSVNEPEAQTVISENEGTENHNDSINPSIPLQENEKATATADNQTEPFAAQVKPHAESSAKDPAKASKAPVRRRLRSHAQEVEPENEQEKQPAAQPQSESQTNDQTVAQPQAEEQTEEQTENNTEKQPAGSPQPEAVATSEITKPQNETSTDNVDPKENTNSANPDAKGAEEEEINELFVPDSDSENDDPFGYNELPDNSDEADADYEQHHQKIINIRQRYLRPSTINASNANSGKKTGRLGSITDSPASGRRARLANGSASEMRKKRSEMKLKKKEELQKRREELEKKKEESQKRKEMLMLKKKEEKEKQKAEELAAREDELLKAVLRGGDIKESDLEAALDRILQGQKKSLDSSLYRTPAQLQNETDFLKQIDLDRPRNLVQNNPTTSQILAKVRDNETIDSDDEDDEVLNVKLDEHDRQQKERIWIALNHDFLIEQEKKRLKIEADILSGNTSGQPRKRRKIKESDPLLNDSAVASAINSIGEGGRMISPAENAKQMLQKKSFSRKINYSKIGDLFNE